MNIDERNYDLLNISVNLKLGTFEGNLQEDLEIDRDNLSESFIDQAGKFAWWSVLYVQAKAIAEKAKSEMEVQKDYMSKQLISELDTKIRHRLELDGEKITEARVEKAIYKENEYIEAVELYNELKSRYLKANADAMTLEVASKAMDSRKDMLISLGAQIRSELNNLDLTMKKEHVREVVSRNRKKSDK